MKKLLLFFLCFVAFFFAKSQPKVPPLLHAMEAAILDGTYPNIHSVLVWHKNKLVYEKYWPGKDKKHWKELGVIAHGVDSLHGTQRVTKTFVSACLGIALAQGKFKSIDQRIFEFFPKICST